MNDKKLNQNNYIMQYKKEKYKKISIDVKKDEAEKILNYCKDMNISQTKFLVKCAKYIIDNDLFDEIMHK